MIFQLYVWCRRNGVSQDAGLHDEQEFADAETAVTTWKNAPDSILQSAYDSIQYTVKQKDTDEDVGGWNYRRRSPEESRYGYGRSLKE
jgi:hypothetical protein